MEAELSRDSTNYLGGNATVPVRPFIQVDPRTVLTPEVPSWERIPNVKCVFLSIVLTHAQ